MVTVAHGIFPSNTDFESVYLSYYWRRFACYMVSQVKVFSSTHCVLQTFSLSRESNEKLTKNMKLLKLNIAINSHFHMLWKTWASLKKNTALREREHLMGGEISELVGFIGKLLEVVVHSSSVQCYTGSLRIFSSCKLILSFNHIVKVYTTQSCRQLAMKL